MGNFITSERQPSTSLVVDQSHIYQKHGPNPGTSRNIIHRNSVYFFPAVVVQPWEAHFFRGLFAICKYQILSYSIHFYLIECPGNQESLSTNLSVEWFPMRNDIIYTKSDGFILFIYNTCVKYISFTYLHYAMQTSYVSVALQFSSLLAGRAPEPIWSSLLEAQYRS